MTDEKMGTDKKAKPTGNPRRQEMLDLVADATEELYVKDGMDLGDPEDEGEQEEESNAAPDNDVDDAEEEQEKPDTEEGDADTEEPQVVDKKLYSLKVNGNELQMTEDELIRRAQEGLSAQQRYEEAARLRREAEQIKAQQPPVKDAAEAVEEDDRALARALQMGTEEEAARVISKLKSRPPVQSDDAARLVDERLSFRTAAEQAQKEFPKLFESQDLAQEFAAMDRNLMASGDNRPYLERYREIGQFLSFRHGIPIQGKKTPLELKKERKASVTPVRAASVRQGAGEAVEEDYESVAAANLRDVVTSRRGQNR